MEISQVSERFKIKAHTLRYYESIGLIQNIERDASGKRAYSEKDLVWLDMIMRLRATGMPIEKMKTYARPVLDLKSKEIAVVAALTAIGTAEPQLKVHINGALNVGCSINEVKEVMLQMSGYSRFPSTINAMNALKEVLEARKKQGIQDKEGALATKTCSEPDRFKQGSKMLAVLDEAQLAILESTYNDFAPDLVKLVVNSYADVISRDNLDLRYRQIATIAALTALGNAKPQLKFHIKAGLNIGLSKEEITEIMYLMTVYTGFPSAINGINALKEVANVQGAVAK
ncbi:carboxymuconolactone decarboxylase family protein [Fusibacter sp. 3D3]|uniref:carboxymuconolactone decarboxylase family protein n=1 Tax=Fusibacter sp. 3D3 TaxID=1048380 RepID=UPI0008580CE6|nr:carboxymuconolactone decarboxylase family protein [Fusibacter sp. 3D3]GAU78370.1 4-carboxymuconolactone decarboxylase [Fusibacter sp. 3D3]